MAPEEEAQELALIYQAKGFDAKQATKLANQIISDPTIALDTLAREELGIDPEELGGSAWEAAITSFLLFAIGAIIPVSPFLFTSGTQAVMFSLAFSAVGLFFLGAAITILTGRSALGVRPAPGFIRHGGCRHHIWHRSLDRCLHFRLINYKGSIAVT